MDVHEMEAQLSALALETFAKYQCDFRPLFPNILVRVLDSLEKRVGSAGIIIAPQIAQQPTVNAVVLRTWAHKLHGHTTAHSQFKEGDIVKMPYWGGVPFETSGMNGDIYRVVPEGIGVYKGDGFVIKGASQEYPHIFATTHMIDKNSVLSNLLDSIAGANSLHEVTKRLEKFIILPKSVDLVD